MQSTSIPGVAQRTGATTYYVEIHPQSLAPLGGRVPIMSLAPVPGCVDLMVASELLEAVRAIQNGFVSSERTTLVTSSQRTLTTFEKLAPGDGRFDSERLLQVAGSNSRQLAAFDVGAATREAGFGDEVKRRIILGTYALSAGYYDAYYGSAQKVRTLIQRDFDAAFEAVDVIATPSAPTTAFRLGERVDDPLQMYLNDVTTIPANLAGVPGISIPSGLAEDDGLPVGIQFLAPVREDARLYRVGAALETLLENAWGGPLLDRAPELTTRGGVS